MRSDNVADEAGVLKNESLADFADKPNELVNVADWEISKDSSTSDERGKPVIDSFEFEVLGRRRLVEIAVEFVIADCMVLCEASLIVVLRSDTLLVLWGYRGCHERRQTSFCPWNEILN